MKPVEAKILSIISVQEIYGDHDTFMARANEVAKLGMDELKKKLLSYTEFKDLRFLVEVYHCVDRRDGDKIRAMVQKRIEEIQDSLGVKR